MTHSAAEIAAELIADLRANRNPRNVEGQRRYGIHAKGEMFGTSLPKLRALGRQHRRNHELAERLWATGAYDARLLAAFVEDPRQITRRQMDRWVRDLDNWAVTDTLMGIYSTARRGRKPRRTDGPRDAPSS